MNNDTNNTTTTAAPARVVYAAYGSNLNVAQMAIRCPAARPCGTGWIKDFRLCFRGVADIEKAEGDRAPVGFWEITPACERALDKYEGFPHLYNKVYFKNDQDDAVVMVYMMNKQRGESVPSEYYYETIVFGYDDFGIDDAPLERAFRESAEYGQDLFPLDSLAYAWEDRIR